MIQLFSSIKIIILIVQSISQY
uniref:Uncharacterized protein n=1 Tax=Rhizophora mucronata TaxID=61149 RepID=A0A2P2QB25_RHIMU